MSTGRTYADLKRRITDWLNRGDLEGVVPQFIELAEDRLRRDTRVRAVTCRGTLTVSADGESLPDDCGAVEAWYHDGPTYFGEIRIVGAEQLGGIKARLGMVGAPQYAAVSDGRLYYAPIPNDKYPTRLTYKRRVPRLSDAAPTNWLLDEHFDVYLYAALAESAPYLADDERIVGWEAILEKRLEDMHKSNQAEQWSGTPRRALGRGRPIGG